ncbi:MAG: hypothetical protein BGO86_12165 [Chryseobacterium sp. 36-9]|uniref:Por secretion system C-terminal sorting domain-containing protein n=1 Tax=Epilithonimonas pallida TaxID=373671 RepID=A0ABY1R596_9FLAO|nr:T9SS type A sorting domain-containing protein [Epilithonimonas pallida]OJX29636.1 MAG: hypothetical protein BGO86_12165 [Chryseobacterium sp. 36-9]SMP94772.1 Por secretion system C-terminal sorting domain-containing protein [Epilithonimonas pallida]
MIKKLFLGLCLILASFVCNAQTISLTGQQFNNWNNDIDLAPSISGVLYTATNVTLVPGEVKFRENHSWTNSWGSGSFPVGVGILSGANINVTTGGIYNITFNKLTGVYAFVLTAFPRVSICGQNIGTAWTTDIFLNTVDGITYNLNNCSMPVGEFKFRLEAGWLVSWGNSGTSLFPNGIAVLAGGNINATVAGNFNVSFNVVTGAYIFTQTLAISDTTKKQIVLNTLVKNDLKFSDQVRNVQVYSMDGRVINSYENVSTINLSTLSNGEYILKIKTKDNEMFSQKIIKN